jgi:RNA polymerase sigma-70 factor (ECF subfamily)
MAVSSPPTPRSLLDRACGGDQGAWRALLVIYEPLLRRWLRQGDLQPADRDDLAQQILTVLVRKLPSFRHSGRPGAFRAWLRSIALHEVADFRRRRAALPGPRDPGDLDALPAALDELARAWDAEYERHVLAGLLALVEPEVTPSAWRAFRRVALEGAAPRAVTAYDAGQCGDRLFLVMESVAGESLAERLRRLGPLKVAEACEAVRQAALGVQHAHDNGLVHRDLKPHNLNRPCSSYWPTALTNAPRPGASARRCRPGSTPSCARPWPAGRRTARRPRARWPSCSPRSPTPTTSPASSGVGVAPWRCWRRWPC